MRRTYFNEVEIVFFIVLLCYRDSCNHGISDLFVNNHEYQIKDGKTNRNEEEIDFFFLLNLMRYNF